MKGIGQDHAKFSPVGKCSYSKTAASKTNNIVCVVNPICIAVVKYRILGNGFRKQELKGSNNVHHVLVQATFGILLC